MAKKTDGRVDLPESATGAGALASEGLLSAWARDELDLTMLTREQQLLLALAALRQEVSTGGFAGYFSSTRAVLEPMAPEAGRIFNESWTELILEAQAVADGLDRDPDAMRASDELRALDRRFEVLNTDSTTASVLDAWAGWNRDSIFRSKRGRFGIL